MRSILAVILLVWFGVAQAEESTVQVDNQGIEKYSLQEMERFSETTQAQSHERYAAFKKDEMDFQYKALISLSITTAFFFLVAIWRTSRLQERTKGDHIVHLTALTLIVYGALALAIIPTPSDAAVGIIGALAGYLFGHASAKAEQRDRVDKL